jgi:hypothetical protein
MLPPEKFGQYYATGHQYKSKGQAIFFEIDPAFRHEFFDLDEVFKRCVPHPDGTPKNSVYAGVYRVLEHIPVSALGKLYLSTPYGNTLGLERGEIAEREAPTLHMYQDLAPVNSLVVSTLDPVDYYHSVTTQPPSSFASPACASWNWAWARWRPIRPMARWAICRIRSCTICAKRCLNWIRRTSKASWCIGCIPWNSRTG